MSTPDEKASAFDPDIPPPPPVSTVGDLTSAHLGSVIETCGLTGELLEVSVDGNAVRLIVQESTRPFSTTFSADASDTCAVLDGDQVEVSDIVDMKDFYAKARELDRVSKAIRDNDAATKELKALKVKLSAELLGTFAQVGESTLPFGDRRAYIHTTLVPEFEEKPDGDGTKYTFRDLVPVFQKLGRDDQITEATVGYQTLQGVLREIRNGVIPMPPELAAMVKINEVAEVRTGVGKKQR